MLKLEFALMLVSQLVAQFSNELLGFWPIAQFSSIPLLQPLTFTALCELLQQAGARSQEAWGGSLLCLLPGHRTLRHFISQGVILFPCRVGLTQLTLHSYRH